MKPRLTVVAGRPMAVPVLREEVHQLGREPLWQVALQFIAGGLAFLALVWGVAMIMFNLVRQAGL